MVIMKKKKKSIFKHKRKMYQNHLVISIKKSKLKKCVKIKKLTNNGKKFLFKKKIKFEYELCVWFTNINNNHY